VKTLKLFQEAKDFRIRTEEHGIRKTWKGRTKQNTIKLAVKTEVYSL